MNEEEHNTVRANKSDTATTVFGNNGGILVVWNLVAILAIPIII